MMIKSYTQFIKENFEQKKAIIITDNGFQDRELLEPKKSLESAGFEVHICATILGDIKAYNSNVEIKVEKLISDVNPDDYNILVLPGGKAPLTLRNNGDVLDFVKTFYQSGKPIAAICHGPLILVSCGLVSDKRMTCYEDVKEELVLAGANFEDSSVVIDGQFITSRNPDDLPQFCDAILKSV